MELGPANPACRRVLRRLYSRRQDSESQSAVCDENAKIMLLIGLRANLPSPVGPTDTPEAALPRSRRAVSSSSPAVRSAVFPLAGMPPGAGPDFINGAASLATELAPRRCRRAACGRARSRPTARPAMGSAGLRSRPAGRGWAGAARRRDAPGTGSRCRRASGDATGGGAPAASPPAGSRLRAGALAEIAPDWRHPRLGRTVAEMLAALPPVAAGGGAPLSDRAASPLPLADAVLPTRPSVS